MQRITDEWMLSKFEQVPPRLVTSATFNPVDGLAGTSLHVSNTSANRMADMERQSQRLANLNLTDINQNTNVKSGVGPLRQRLMQA